MNREALEAALRLATALRARTKTHLAPRPPERKSYMTEAERRARVRNGHRTGPIARRRKSGPRR